MKLHAAIGRLEAKLGAVDLAHIGVVPAGAALVYRPDGAVGEQLAGLILGVEISHGELHSLAFGQRLAERHALLRIFADHLEAALRHTEAMGGLMDSIARDPGLRLAHA